MNPLSNYPAVRAVLYAVQWLVNGVLLLAGAYFVLEQTALEDLPRWYVLATGLGPVLWTYLGITAQANVPTDETEYEVIEVDTEDEPVEPEPEPEVFDLPTDTIHGGTGRSGLLGVEDAEMAEYRAAQPPDRTL